MAGLVNDAKIKLEIDLLIRNKSASKEKTLIPPVKILNNFIEEEIDFCKSNIEKMPVNNLPIQNLNSFFMDYLY